MNIRQARTVADDLRVRAHLLSMDLKDGWESLRREAIKGERRLARAGAAWADGLSVALEEAAQAVARLRDRLGS